MKRNALRCCLVFALTIGVPDSSSPAGAAKKTAKPIDHSSPQKIAEEFTRAMGAKDWQRAFSCNTEKSRMTLLMMGAMIPAGFATVNDEAKKQSLQSLMKKHGELKPDDLSNVKKLAAIFGDLQEWMQENLPKRNGKPQPDTGTQIANAKYQNFKIKGDVATADVYQNGRKTPTAAYFKRANGKWYFDAYEAARHSNSGFKLNIKMK